MLDKLDRAFDFDAFILNLYSYRQELLASNIANSDTPNYQPLDINFSKIFKQLLNKKRFSQVDNLTLTSKNHISISKNKKFNNYNELLKKDYIIKKDKIDVDSEKVNFINNSLLYQMNITFINNKFKNLMNVLKG
ncbi:hypothetical protein XW81_01560 [Buchnera aphidicola (Schlechtendalia chinensis)]|uniref:Flagellar basal body rod protein FlgB n=1 Tax=Buchnera aphidicola subsp. Schlechtendalia chinensis TaxID=118110 RepID=A0A172WDN0_BUCSC|nr:flagellar basal body rod protein FlgB [Buchnera aphidicola]ANF17086.1 hypothetical protein XW81_01560 [Buchnera aphidicola (Schlechtendalia chinensis)]